MTYFAFVGCAVLAFVMGLFTQSALCEYRQGNGPFWYLAWILVLDTAAGLALAGMGVGVSLLT